MLICVGEILVDVFQDGKKETALPGGAPFNVACNATLYTKDVCFIGKVGDDENGRLLLKAAKDRGLEKGIAIHPTRKTSRAIVSLEDGERSFRFDRDNGADYALTLDDVDLSSIKKGDIVHIGSLMLSSDEGVAFYTALIKALRKIEGVKISFDINYRDDIFPSSEVAKLVFVNALKEADILKFSSDELLFLSGKDDIESALRALLNPTQSAAITLGKDGSLLYHKGKLIHVPSVPVKPIDTTGAGDAFYSYFLASLVNDPSFLDDEEKVKKYLSRANAVGAIATLKKGAIGVAPSEEEIDKFLA